MRRLTANAVECLLFAGLIGCPAAVADSMFTIEDPPVDFQVVDTDPFDGIGNYGPYSTYSDVLLGTIGEIRSMAEFDISPFTVPPDEVISAATLEVRITAIEIYGLGVNGETPGSLAVDGYIGDGIASLSDFQIADGNVLDAVQTPNPYIGQILSFDVTQWVTEVYAQGEPYVGLTARAESFGGLWVGEGNGYPKLTIETASACPADFDGDGDVDTADLLFLLGAWGTPDGDVDGDGDTDTSDLLALLAAWGEC